MPYLLVSFSKRRAEISAPATNQSEIFGLFVKTNPGKACFCVHESQLIVETMSVRHTDNHFVDLQLVAVQSGNCFPTRIVKVFGYSSSWVSNRMYYWIR